MTGKDVAGTEGPKNWKQPENLKHVKKQAGGPAWGW